MLISVVMPVHDGDRFLADAIESIRAQTHRDWELVAVDDGSTDGTWPILEAQAARDQRIRIFRQPNRGVAVARNRALAECRAEWVTNLDCDDLMLPERLERQLAFLAAHPAVKVFACRAYYINAEGRVLGKTRREPFTTAAELHHYLARGGIVGINQPSAMMHRPTVLELGGYRPQFRAAEDIDLWNRVVDAGHLLLLQDELLTQYRIHGGSMVTSQMRAVLMEFEWAKACILARRAGRAEPTREAFTAGWLAKPWLQRIAALVLNEAKTQYRAAAFDVASARTIRAVARLGLASLYRPDYVLRRLAGQLTLRRPPGAG